MIPVTLLTGFLGSGKTTLLSHALRTPEFSRTAVIINEFGEIGLDHELIAASDEQFVALTTGCLCCKVQSDLVVTLEDLLARREAGSVMRFERVVIETSGLADPAPILHALMTTPSLAGQLAPVAVVTTVDAVTGEATLAREPVSVKQAAVADRLVITKTDMTGGMPPSLVATLDAINAQAPRSVSASTAHPFSPCSALAWGEGGGEGRQHMLAEQAAAPHVMPEVCHQHVPLPVGGQTTGRADDEAHLSGISTFTILRDAPLAAVTLTLFLEALAEHAGANLLRLKGLVAVAEAPDRPAVVHGVQHVFHPLDWLDRWPSEDRRTRLVFITRGISRAWVDVLLAAIECEVAEVGVRPMGLTPR
jgi:G3E family GTPase